MPPFRLGRIPSSLDIQDYKLTSFIAPRKLDVAGEKLWDFLAEPLDQGDTEHCVGFAMANFGINLPIQTPFTNQDGHDFYRKCKVLDLDPYGENGTSIRSAAKVLKSMGIIESYAFAQSIDEMSWWLLNKGPMIVGTDWTEDMFTPNVGNIIRPTGAIAGGHGYLINEKTDDEYFGIQNSWDDLWGTKGKAHISIADFSLLFRHGGEAIAAVEVVPGILNTPTGGGCIAAILKALGLS